MSMRPICWGEIVRRPLAFMASVTLFLAVLAAAPGAEAEPVTPTLTVGSADVVAQGAAVAVAFTVTCPAAESITYLDTTVTQASPHGTVTARDTLELVCTGGVQRLTNVVKPSHGSVSFGAGNLAVAATLVNCVEEDPACY